MKRRLKNGLIETMLSVLGGMIYAVSFSLFVSQAGLFIGNITGFAQMLQAFLETLFPSLPDITGILLFALNAPLFLLSYKVINRTFFWRSLITTGIQSLTMLVMPQLDIFHHDNLLTLVLLGGALAGYGVGLSLRHGGSGGGLDIIGVYMSLKQKNLSVGKVSLLISLIVYIYAFTKHSAIVMIYSIIFTVVYSLVIDYTHYQNVKSGVLISTKNVQVITLISDVLKRPGTHWEAKDVLTRESRIIISVAVSKAELIRLRRMLMERDPEAQMMEFEHIGVTGSFEPRFFSELEEK